jgi:hypothetical protein
MPVFRQTGLPLKVDFVPGGTNPRIINPIKNMKKYFLLLVSLLSLALNTTAAPARDFDDNYRFIFYAVMEGCYEDGIATTNVDQILLMNTNVGFVHFVYACPLCTPTIHALEAYRSRPKHFAELKTHATTFGPGLNEEQIKKLYSDHPSDRLEVINGLMQTWVTRRMTELRLTGAEKTQLKQNLEKMRQEGMKMLKNFQNGDPERFKMSAFAEVQQCAVCNGACCMKLKPGDK